MIELSLRERIWILSGIDFALIVSSLLKEMSIVWIFSSSSLSKYIVSDILYLILMDVELTEVGWQEEQVKILYLVAGDV